MSRSNKTNRTSMYVIEGTQQNGLTDLTYEFRCPHCQRVSHLACNPDTLTHGATLLYCEERKSFYMLKIPPRLNQIPLEANQ